MSLDLRLGLRRREGELRQEFFRRTHLIIKRQQWLHRPNVARLVGAETPSWARLRQLVSERFDRFWRGYFGAGRAFERLDELEGCRVAIDGLLGERAGKHRLQGRKMGPGKWRHGFDRVHSRSDQSPPPQHLVHDRREAEHIRPAIPTRSRQAFRGRVWAANRSRRADMLERPSNTDADDAGTFW